MGVEIVITPASGAGVGPRVGLLTVPVIGIGTPGVTKNVQGSPSRAIGAARPPATISTLSTLSASSSQFVANGRDGSPAAKARWQRAPFFTFTRMPGNG